MDGAAYGLNTNTAMRWFRPKFFPLAWVHNNIELPTMQYRYMLSVMLADEILIIFITPAEDEFAFRMTHVAHCSDWM